jgi:hypothetical protein
MELGSRAVQDRKAARAEREYHEAVRDNVRAEAQKFPAEVLSHTTEAKYHEWLMAGNNGLLDEEQQQVDFATHVRKLAKEHKCSVDDVIADMAKGVVYVDE